MRLLVVFILSSILLLNSSFSYTHSYYVSITTIDHKKNSKLFEISIKLTAHDVEKALIRNGDLKLGDEKEMDNADEILSDYFKKHLQIWANGGKLQLRYVGKEVSLDETLMIYLDCKSPRVLNKLKIQNDILCTTFSEQENIVYINTKDDKKSYTFKRNNSVKEFQFK